MSIVCIRNSARSAHRILLYKRPGTCGAHFNVISALGDIEHEVNVLFLFDLVIARQDGSCTLCCLGGGSEA
jgi:hypothetical protein